MQNEKHENRLIPMMRKFVTITLLLVATFIISSCETNVEQPATELLEKARTEFVEGKYNNARLLIDSIRVVSPKAYKTLREAEQLRRKVLVKEKERDVEYLQGELSRYVAVRDTLAAGFTFNKDTRLGKGYYIVPSQNVVLNQQNNYLRAYVNEDGTMYLTSFYRGKGIGHTTVKVSSGSSYASCDEPFLSRKYKDLGVNNERCDYRYGQDDGLIDFMLAAQGALEVELSGGKGSVRYALRNSDVEAVRSIYHFSQAILAARHFEELLGEAQHSLEFLLRSEQRSVAGTSFEPAAE